MPIGMLLPSTCAATIYSPKIEDCEDEYPHQIDEVPIQAHDLDDLVFSLPAGQKARPLVIQVSAYDLDGHG